MKPIFFQLTVPETTDRSWVEQKMRGLSICAGFYQEFRILPVTWRLSLNFLNCYASLLDWLLSGTDFDVSCNFRADKKMFTE